MNALRRKLRSERGASITFALMLFLICAVVSAVLVVTGSVAGGRMAATPEMDQRYYAVTSAADLLKDMLDGKTVTVETTKTAVIVYNEKGYRVVDDGGGTPKIYNEDGNLVEYDDDGNETVNDTDHPTDPFTVPPYFDDGKVRVDGEIITPGAGLSAPALTILQEAACRLTGVYGFLQGNKGGDQPFSETLRLRDQSDTSQTGIDPDNNDPFYRKIELTAGSGLEDWQTALKVRIYEKLDENGIITFYITKAKDTDPDQAYTLKLSFKADGKTQEDRTATDSTPYNVASDADGTTYLVNRTVELKRSAIITWTLTDTVKCGKTELEEVSKKI